MDDSAAAADHTLVIQCNQVIIFLLKRTLLAQQHLSQILNIALKSVLRCISFLMMREFFIILVVVYSSELLNEAADFRANHDSALKHGKVPRETNHATNSFHPFVCLLSARSIGKDEKTPIASSYRPFSPLKLYLDAIWETLQVSDKDRNTPGIILVIESKEQRHKLPQGSDHEFKLPFPMCQNEHKYDLLVLVYE
ncbi:hypothetical protein BSL78_15750 [Apostichopus japonicus]|uniref:Uncharacterized protein n=1 Tax=Stichopus japonicus TaxID=307972 RepID=A0A2G8KHD6_STIJA|nr:hypothetical protein BSL78_15750 [Apostichopus japonicus]